jgi:hypothetical protein
MYNAEMVQIITDPENQPNQFAGQTKVVGTCDACGQYIMCDADTGKTWCAQWPWCNASNGNLHEANKTLSVNGSE